MLLCRQPDAVPLPRQLRGVDGGWLFEGVLLFVLCRVGDLGLTGSPRTQEARSRKEEKKKKK